MKKTSIRKLAMKRETLRKLTAPDMARVAGGAPTDLCSQACSKLDTRCDCQTRACDTRACQSYRCDTFWPCQY